MSETTATRTGSPWRRLAGGATIAVVAALWILAALLLWRTTVPSNLDVSGLDVHRYFTDEQLSKTLGFERFLRIDWVLATLASLASLAVIAWRAPGVVRGIGLGRIGKGLIIGMVTLVAQWFATVPFQAAAWWWSRRHGIARGSILEWWSPQLPALATGALLSALSILIVLALAGRFPRNWWIPAAGVFTAFGLLFTFVLPYLDTLGAHRIHDPRLRAEAKVLARQAGAAGVPTYVDDVSKSTTAANALSEGVGPSRRVVVWNTMLQRPFTYQEDRVVLAHEFTHAARNHLWKGVAWFGLFAIPGTFLVAFVTRRRGGMREPANIPLALLVIAVLQLISLPVQNEISRRYEAEADWGALRVTHDPAAARGLFRKFSSTDLQQPNPPLWDYFILETHPTIAQRIQMANAWGSRHRRSRPAKPGSAGG